MQFFFIQMFFFCVHWSFFLFIYKTEREHYILVRSLGSDANEIMETSRMET